MAPTAVRVQLAESIRVPPLSAYEDTDLPTVQRYIAACKELAESSVLAHRGGIEVSDTGERVVVTADLPTKEAMRGTDVLFRQIQEPNEPASYLAIRKIIGRRTHDTADAGKDRRESLQRLWHAAHGRLNTYLLTYLADAKVLGRPDPQNIVTAPDRTTASEWPGAEVQPMLTLSLFRYGDFIHWGRRREEFAIIARDNHELNFAYMDYLNVVLQLSHFYIGYSMLAAAAFGLELAKC